MTQKKYQIFVSSTFRDLVEERQDAIRNILDLKHIPAGMELFPAADVDQLAYIKKVIDECDYYLLIVGGRYGSMDADGISYTEREYDYAVSSGKVVIAFVHSDPASIPVGKSDLSQESVEALNAFREKVMTGRLVRTWTTRQELEPMVLKSLIHAFNDAPQAGWVRGNNLPSQELLEQSNKILQENADLRKELKELKGNVPVKIEDIADIDDIFTVRYQSKSHDSRGSSKYTDRDFSLTWRDIFQGVAGELDKPKTNHAILAGFRRAASDAGCGYKPYSINDSDKVTIKIQLEALGLISTRVSKTMGGGVEEFLELTPRGRNLFITDRVVRRG